MGLPVWPALALLAVAVAGAGAEPASAPLWARSSFSVRSTLLLSELAGAPRDVGYRLSGQLALRPLAVEDDRLLLGLRVRGVQLEVRGTHARAEWQPRGPPWGLAGDAGDAGGEWRALWRRGALVELWLPAAAPRDAADYMRALTGLFQFQSEEGRRNETDISGECEVTYETISPTVFRKTKRRCAFEAAAGEAGVRARRVSRYTLAAGGGALAALHAEELVWLAAVGEPAEGRAPDDRAGVKARSWHELELIEGEPAAEPAPAGEPSEPPAHLRPTPLALPLDERDDADDEAETLEEAVERHGAALAGEEAGGGGSRAAAAALAPLLAALAAAPAPELHALLRREDLQPLLPGLCRALGLAGTAAGWAAARALVAPGAADALEPLAHQYLAGLALAPRPDAAVVADVLALADEARAPAVAESALLAGAAAAARASPAAARAARDRLARAAARARSPEERALRLRALGNLRPAEAGALLGAAERGAGAEAEAALGALRGAALSAAQASRALALAADAARPLAERALALELGAEALCAERARAVPLALARLARALAAERSPAAGELLRALWQRLETLAERPAAAALLRALPRDLAGWDAQAPPGTTSVLRRRLGWRAAGAEAELLSAQLAAGGLLRRGRVELRVRGRDLLAVDVWTRGLGALAGQEEGEEGEQEGPAAGLALEAGGAALRPRTLFAGRTELLAHVWAGTGAAPTPVLRALLPLVAVRARVPLQAGAALTLSARASAALALDAQAAASLWQRTARARLALRAAGHAEARAEVRVRGATLSARAALAGEARLRVAPDLDFYDRAALCVRADVEPHELERSAELRSSCGSRSHRVRRVRTAVWRRPGRELALGRDNSAACRALAAADAEGDL